MMVQTRRKYAMTRIEAGDYLLPSNDAKRLYRLTSYTDGPTYGLVDWPRDRVVWAVDLFTGSPDEGERLARAVEDYGSGDWHRIADYLDTRGAAIEQAIEDEGLDR